MAQPVHVVRVSLNSSAKSNSLSSEGFVDSNGS
jgi:hypothetical protein